MMMMMIRQLQILLWMNEDIIIVKLLWWGMNNRRIHVCIQIFFFDESVFVCCQEYRAPYRVRCPEKNCHFFSLPLSSNKLIGCTFFSFCFLLIIRFRAHTYTFTKLIKICYSFVDWFIEFWLFVCLFNDNGVDWRMAGRNHLQPTIHTQ